MEDGSGYTGLQGQPLQAGPQAAQQFIGDGAAGIGQVGGGDACLTIPADQGSHVAGPGLGDGSHIHQ